MLVTGNITYFTVFRVNRQECNFAIDFYILTSLMKFKPEIMTLAAAVMLPLAAAGTTTVPADSTVKKEKRSFVSRLTLGGYGEACYTRNFYSDNGNRYSHAADYKDAPSHGRFDLPHVVVNLGFDFGRGWSMNSEIEFEHGGVGSAVELEAEEVGEFESEVERGGEVVLEQFYIQKSFMPQLNVRVGMQIVPVGYTNGHHLPTEFFTVYRPEGENQIMPCTWHQTGIDIWGRAGDWRYEAMLLPGLNSSYFSKDEWIKNGTTSPFEFEPANRYAVAARVDNYSVPGLRIGVSGYYGQSFANTLQSDKGKYASVRGDVWIAALDFTYRNAGWIARGAFDYGHLSNADEISIYNRNQSKTSPYKRTYVGKGALNVGVEAGYDIFRLFADRHLDGQQFYLFGRYEYYDAYIPTENAPAYDWTNRNRMAVGINWFPIKQIVVKAEFSERFLKKQYNNEPSVSIGVAYAGYFL